MLDPGKTIEQAKRQLQQMVDLNPQTMLLTDRNGVVVRVNRPLLELLGLPDFAAVLGKGLAELFPSAAAKGAERDAKRFFARLLSGKKGYQSLEKEILLPTNRKRTLQFTAVGSGREADLLVVMAKDVTREKGLDVRRERKFKMQAVEALTGALMHKLNQPLTVIVIRSQLMTLLLERGSADPGEMRSGLEDITSLALRISEVLKTVGSPTDFVTERYLGNVDILDIDRSTGNAAPIKTGPPRRGRSRVPDCNSVLDELMAACDRHEPGAVAHSRRTAECAAVLARRMGLSDDDVGKVRRCAMSHDIGKLCVPDSLLQKPGTLTADEMQLMKQHADTGYRLLSGFRLTDEAKVAHAHHERFDGSGYPGGLPGDAIHPVARIVAVADTLDAICRDRPYRAAAPFETAVSEVVAASGRLFAPEVVEALKACQAELGVFFPSKSPRE